MDRVIPQNAGIGPTLGLVIGTFAAVPYVEMGLYSATQLQNASVQVLVHDDGSPAASVIQLTRLERKYAPTFLVSGAARFPPSLGDMSCYLTGLQWAQSNRIDLLVKFSRRYIPLEDWTVGLRTLVAESDCATYSNVCRHFGYGFRTECIAMGVRAWTTVPVEVLGYSGTGAEIIKQIIQKNQPVFVESVMHQIAQAIHRECRSEITEAWDARNPRPADSTGYAAWPRMGESRVEKRMDNLWHDADAPIDYARAARWKMHLDIREELFRDPNMGWGNGA